jgi:flagellar protein FliS
MMQQRNGAQHYHAVRSQGQIADASPARLVQVMFEHILSQLAVAQACIERLNRGAQLADVMAKGKAIGKAVRLIGQLDATLDMEKGAPVAQNLHQLYMYMLGRLTSANANNDAATVAEVVNLVRTVKIGWDTIVADGR